VKNEQLDALFKPENWRLNPRAPFELFKALPDKIRKDAKFDPEKTQDAQASCLKAKTAARLINAFGAAALTLQRLQAGVGHNFHQVQINGHVIGHIGK
jgi:hypothetical protein